LETALGGKKKEHMRAQKGGTELDFLKSDLSDMMEQIQGKVQHWNTLEGKRDGPSIAKRHS